jgi:hypothetical protein
VIALGIVLAIALAVVPIIVIGPGRAFDTDHRPLWIAFVANFCLGVGFLVLIVLWSLYFRPSPRINLSACSFKIRGKVVPFTEVDTAIMRYESGDKTARITLTFGRQHGPKGSIRLTPGSEAPADGSPRAHLIAAFRESSIHRPTSPYDPSGRFARHNFPDYLDKDAAIAVVKNPPAHFAPRP